MKNRFTDISKRLRKAGKVIIDMLYPRCCPICDGILAKDEPYICKKCVKVLPVIKGVRCSICGRPLNINEDLLQKHRKRGIPEHTNICKNCRNTDHNYTRGRCSFLYENFFRESVIRMKFQNRREYLGFYALAMAALNRQFLREVKPAVIIPVPMNKRKRRERGFDQCALLADKLSKRVQIPVMTDAVKRVRYTKPQKGLSGAGRVKNLEGAFVVTDKGRAIQGPVLLLDDIYTTGATLDAVAGVLKEAGIREIYFLALCMRTKNT